MAVRIPESECTDSGILYAIVPFSWVTSQKDLLFTENLKPFTLVFAKQQKYVKSLQPYEVFMANIEAGNDEQLMIRSLIKSYGLTLGTKKGHNVICAISTLEAIYEKHGYHGLSRVLQLIIGAWEGDLNSFSANILNAVARLTAIYGDSLDDEIFINRLGAISVKQLTAMRKTVAPDQWVLRR